MNGLYAYAFLSLWLAWMLGWYVASFGTKRTVRLESVGSRLGHILPLLVAGSLMANPNPSLGELDRRLIHTTSTWFWTCFGFAAAGLLFTAWARVHLGRNWSGTVTVKEEHALITTGPYGLVRHPIYTGLLTAFLGSALALGNGRGMLAFVIASVALWRKLRLEEAWMQQTFGEAYAVYKARVRALVPYIV